MQSLSLAADRVKRILTLMKSQNVAIYNKKQTCRKPAPFDKGAKCGSAFRWIVRSGGHGGVGAVKALLLYYRTLF